MKETLRAKPSLLWVLKLKCPYCTQTPLREDKSWFTFRRGCLACNYRFERELGYYTGASWMITFPLTALFGLVLGGLGIWLFPEIKGLYLACVAGLLSMILAVAIVPFCMAFWMYLDHSFHPLNGDDSYDKELLN